MSQSDISNITWQQTLQNVWQPYIGGTDDIQHVEKKILVELMKNTCWHPDTKPYPLNTMKTIDITWTTWTIKNTVEIERHRTECWWELTQDPPGSWTHTILEPRRLLMVKRNTFSKRSFMFMMKTLPLLYFRSSRQCSARSMFTVSPMGLPHTIGLVPLYETIQWWSRC